MTDHHSGRSDIRPYFFFGRGASNSLHIGLDCFLIFLCSIFCRTSLHRALLVAGVPPSHGLPKKEGNVYFCACLFPRTLPLMKNPNVLSLAGLGPAARPCLMESTNCFFLRGRDVWKPSQYCPGGGSRTRAVSAQSEGCCNYQQIFITQK